MGFAFDWKETDELYRFKYSTYFFTNKEIRAIFKKALTRWVKCLELGMVILIKEQSSLVLSKNEMKVKKGDYNEGL